MREGLGEIEDSSKVEYGFIPLRSFGGGDPLRVPEIFYELRRKLGSQIRYGKNG
jgi:hypothetical protein